MSYGYDSFGNLTQVPGGTPLAPGQIYHGNNRYQAGNALLPGSFACTGVHGETGGYDGAGNQLCWGSNGGDETAQLWEA